MRELSDPPVAANAARTDSCLELDLRRYELRSSGRRLRLEKQPMELLILLVGKKGELVTREEIAQQLWGKDVFVDTDQSIHAAIRKIRMALRDDPAEPRFVETVVGKGYRFIGPITVIEPVSVAADQAQGPLVSSKHKPGRRRTIAWLAGVLAAILLCVWMLVRISSPGSRGRAEIRSLAVLPLDNMSGDPTQEYFSDGITDELITDLAQIRSLTVISRTTVMQYKGARKTLPQIAAELHVDGVVEGSVLRSKESVRIRVQLVQGATDRHLWASSYERQMTDVVSLEREVARAIADQISAEITPREKMRLNESRPISPAAYDDYLRSRYLLHHSRNPVGIRQSVELAESAVKADSNYPLAFAGLAEAYFSWSYAGGGPTRELMPKAREAAQKAVTLDDGLSEAHAVLGTIDYTYDWDWPNAEKELLRAIELNPNNSDAHLFFANYYIAVADFPRAHVEIDRARQLDPLSLWINRDAGRVYLYEHKPREAVQALLQALEIDPNNRAGREATDPFLWLAYEEEGEKSKALATRLELISFKGVSATGLDALDRAGKSGGMKAFCRQLVRTQHLPQFGYAYLRAIEYLGAGDKAEAFHWLDEAVKERNVGLTWIKVDPALVPLHSDPRWPSILRQVGVPN